MHSATPTRSAPRTGALGFALAVLQAVSWRAILITQSLGLAFALAPWLEQWHRPGQPHLAASLTGQALSALLVMLAALAGDEAVRRGESVWRAFVAALLSASALNVAGQWLLVQAFSTGGAERGLLAGINDFLSVGGLWGTALMAYLNRQSARRLLARLRADELERVQAERRLIASRLAAAEAQVDPAAVLRQLADTRDLYASGRPGAEERLEALIAQLRDRVARGVERQPSRAPP